jgi:hypothetical protein
MKKAVSVFWFRRDLRWQDNAGLYYALYQAKLEGHQVLPIFVFDKTTGSVGIGTSSLGYPLQVRRVGGAGTLGISIDNVKAVNICSD